eukprot:227104-Rhodomonas_salina.2
MALACRMPSNCAVRIVWDLLTFVGPAASLRRADAALVRQLRAYPEFASLVDVATEVMPWPSQPEEPQVSDPSRIAWTASGSGFCDRAGFWHLDLIDLDLSARAAVPGRANAEVLAHRDGRCDRQPVRDHDRGLLPANIAAHALCARC